MIRSIYIICEGQTEEEFVIQILRPYFIMHQIYDVRPILMTTSKGNKGGDIGYERLKKNINNLLLRENDILVTTFIDFYKLKNDFPDFQAAQMINDKANRVSFLEKAIANDFQHQNVIPYIQLHEFEGLLFAAKDGFSALPTGLVSAANLQKLMLTVDEKENPEDINDGELTAPSKRLAQLIPGYDKNKPLYGSYIAEANSIHAILKRCKRFTYWIEKLIVTVHKSSE